MPVPRTHLKPTLKDLYDYLDELEGTAEQLTTGTDETPRLYSAKEINDLIDSKIDAIGE